jgi:hypothetical protein
LFFNLILVKLPGLEVSTPFIQVSDRMLLHRFLESCLIVESISALVNPDRGLLPSSRRLVLLLISLISLQVRSLRQLSLRPILRIHESWQLQMNELGTMDGHYDAMRCDCNSSCGIHPPAARSYRVMRLPFARVNSYRHSARSHYPLAGFTDFADLPFDRLPAIYSVRAAADLGIASC